jgi:hypothetical protein
MQFGPTKSNYHFGIALSVFQPNDTTIFWHKRPHKYKYDKCSTNFKNTCACRACTLLVYTIRSEDNWKLFSLNSDPPYPSCRTHSSGCMMTKKGGTTIESQFGEHFWKKELMFLPLGPTHSRPTWTATPRPSAIAYAVWPSPRAATAPRCATFPFPPNPPRSPHVSLRRAPPLGTATPPLPRARVISHPLCSATLPAQSCHRRRSCGWRSQHRRRGRTDGCRPILPSLMLLWRASPAVLPHHATVAWGWMHGRGQTDGRLLTRLSFLTLLRHARPALQASPTMPLLPEGGRVSATPASCSTICLTRTYPLHSP